MGEIWMVTAAHGGAGKTTLTAQLGRALARRSKRSALIDLNIGLGDLDIALGLQDAVIYNVLDVSHDLCRPSQALIADPRQEGLYLLPAGATGDERALSESGFARTASALRERFDICLIDAPPPASSAFRIAAGHADRVIFVAGGGRDPRAIRNVAGRLFQEGAGRAELVLNRVEKKDTAAICEALGQDAVFCLERDMSRAGALAEFDALAGVLLGEMTPPKTVKKSAGGDLLGRFQHWLDGAAE